MPDKITLDPIELDDSPIELDNMIELDEPEKPGFFSKAADVAKEFTAGVGDIAKSWEAEHKRRGRGAEGEVQLGLDVRDWGPNEKKRMAAKSAELQQSGKSYDAQLTEMNEFRAQIVKERSEAGVKGAQRLQEAMPKPKLMDDAGFIEQAARGMTRFGPAMVATALSGPAGFVATFQAIRGNKLDELEQKKAQELKGVTDSWHIKEIENKYSDQKNMDTATLDSILATPVEQLGTVLELGVLSKLLKGSSGRLKTFMKGMAKTSATEGAEEWIQTHTGLIADKFQENQNKAGGEVWTEIADEFFTQKHQKKAGYGAALGAAGGLMLGSPAGAINIAQSIEQKAALSDLTSDERAQLKTNPLLTADDLRKDRGLPKETETTEEGFGALEEDVQVAEDPTAMSSGVGERGVILLEEKLRTESERVEATKIAREQAKRQQELEKQQAAEAAQRKAAEEAQQQAEAKRQAELNAQEQFENSIVTRPGLINQSIQAVAVLENSSDPITRKAVAPIRKAQAALATREDSAKRLMTIQNDLYVELERGIKDPRVQALMIRLDEELNVEIAKADALAAAKEAEVEAKKVEKQESGYARKQEAIQKLKKPAATLPKPATKLPPQKYGEYKTKVEQAAVKARILKQEQIEKTKAAIEKATVIKKAKAAKIAKTKAAIAAEKKKRGIRYEKVAGQVTPDTQIAGARFGDTLNRITQAKPVRKALAKMAKTQGKSFYVDVMHPGKIGARIYKEQRDMGVSPAVAKANVKKSLDTYTPVYNQVAARYLKIKKPAIATVVAPTQDVAVATAAIRREVLGSVAKAKIHLKGVTGIEVVHKSTDLKTVDPQLFEDMKHYGTHGTANALFDPNTKKIYVFTENADTTYKAKQAIWHEFGHFSLGELLGPDHDSVVQLTAKKYPDAVAAKVEEGYADETLAAEEVLIDMFTKNETNTAVQKFKNLWDRFIQKIGFTKGEITEADVRSLVAKMRKRLLDGKVKPSEVKRIKSIAKDGWKAQVQDIGTPQARYLIDKVKWTVDQDRYEFGTVNNRMQKELEVFEKLFGATPKASMMPGKYDVKTGKRPATRTITARDMGEELERVRKDGTLKRYLDPKVPAETIVKERGLTGKEKLHFLQELKDLRSGPLYIDDSVKIDKKVVSSNDKAGMSLDFWLGTCQPTQPCKECYAASTYFRMSAVKKSFRNTAYILAEPKLWAKKVAAEIKAIPQTKIPFIRLLGSGDMTFSEQVKGFNELAKAADRPIHIFSRHHDNLRKLKGTKKAPFMRMASIDTQLFDHYGIKYLEENAKRGIVNAFLYTDKAELPKINKLIAKDSLGLVLSADTKLHETLSPEAQATSCPCDAGERGAFGSCRMCAMSEAGCFMGFAAKGFDTKGKIWDLTDVKAPSDIMPFTAFLKDAQATKVMGKKAQAYSNVAVDMFSKSMTYTQQQILWFGQGKQVDMKLRDIRYPEQVARTKDVKAAEAWKENLGHMRDEAKKGTFVLPSGEIQPTVEFKEGQKIKYDRTMFKSRRELARAKEAELAKFQTPTRPKKKFRPGKIAFTKGAVERKVIKQKAQVKSLIIGGIQKGAYTGAVRFAPVADIKQLIKDGEIKIPLHATPILGKDYDAIPAYGDNTKTPAAMIVPQQHIEPKPDAHTNEAYIKKGTPLSEIVFIFPNDTQKYARAMRVPDKKLKYSIKTPAFKKWFKKSVVNEKGVPIELYHGTTHDFTEFDPSSAYIDNFLGKSLYFTDNPIDASKNYGSLEGADIQARIGYAEDSIRDQVGGMDVDAVQERWPHLTKLQAEDLIDWESTAEKIIHDLATKEIAGQSLGSVMPVYVRIEKPLYINGDKETEFTLEPDWDHYESEAKDFIDRDNYNNNEDYNDDLREKAEELYYEDYTPLEFGNMVDLKNAFFDTANDWGNFNPDDVWNAMREDTNFEYEVAASDLFQGIMEHTDVQEIQDYDTGEYANREFLREWITRAGFDGVVLNATKQFPGMFVGQTTPTTHYMPFKGNQVKSVFNMGTWKPEVNDIRYSIKDIKDKELEGVAFKHPKTGKVYKGKPGQTHGEVMDNNFGDFDNWPDLDNELDMGYVHKSGKFLNRKEVANLMGFEAPAFAESINLSQWGVMATPIKYSRTELKSAGLEAVAFKHPSGKIYAATKPMIHAQLLEKHFTNKELYEEGLARKVVDGFVDKAGTFYNRDEALAKIGYPESRSLRAADKLKYSKVTPAQQTALDHIGLREGKKKDSNLLEMSWFDKFMQGATDSLRAIGKMEQGKELGTQSGYKSFNMLSNFPAMFSTFLNNGRVKFQDNWMSVTPEKDGGLFNVQNKLGDQADNFFKRLTAKSAKEILDKNDVAVASGQPSRFKKGVNLFGKDFETGESLNDRKMVKDLLAGTVTEYRANKELWDWAENRLKELNTSVLDMAVSSNLIDPTARKKFEREYYVPFFRIADDLETGEVSTMFPKTGDPTHIAKLHKLGGSHRNVGDPFNNLVNNYSFILHESLKNLARGKSLNLAKQMGLIEKTNKAGKNTIGVRVKGQETMYDVKDPLLYKSLVDVDTITNGWMSEGLGKMLLRNPKLWLTKFVTYDPSFRIANFLRDTMHTAFMQKGFIPIVSSLRGGYHALRQTDEFKEFASTGGAFTGAYHERDVRLKTAEEVKRLKKRIKRKTGTKFNPMKLLDMYRAIGEASENAARMGVYMIQKKQGKTGFEAAYSAKDLLDFHRSGTSGMLSFLTQTVPFLNARIQGMYKLGRTAADAKTRKNFFVMAALLSAASTAYFFMGPGDDDRYKELTDADKMMYWHFYDVPGVGHLKIPKPFEVGAFFGSIPEAFMEYVEGQRDGKDLAKYTYGIFRDMLRLDMPQSAKVLAQQWANKDYFTGAPIVPSRQAGARAEVQYGERTSKLARMIGANIEKVTGDSPWASPRRIQKVFEDLFSYGTYMASYLTDMAIQQTNMYPSDPALADGEGFSRLVLGTGRFIKGEAVPKYTKSQQEFYEMLKEVNAAADTFRIYKRMKDRKAAKKFRKEYRQEIRVGKKMASWQRKISKYNQKIDIILASKKYTAQEKREKIDALILKRLKVFQKATTWGKQKLND